MKVAIVMFYDDKIKQFADLNYLINKKYCQKYNLDIIVSHQKKYPSRYSAWERLPLVLKHLTNYDYLIWVDADAFFYPNAGNILSVINDNPAVDFIFSKDIGNQNINSGIFIVKNTAYSKIFLEKWAYDEQLYKNNPFPGWWDQGVLIDMFNQNLLNIKEHSIEYEYGCLQDFYEREMPSKNPYIYHMAGSSNFIRYTVSKQYYDKIYN